MDNLRWLEDVQQRLLRRGIPSAYAQRLTDELNDHLKDLKEETMGNEAVALTRLGELNQIAEMAVATYQRRSFLGRHPVAAALIFAVSPVVSLIIAVWMVTLTIVLIFSWLGFISENGLQLEPTTKAALPYALTALTIILPSILVTLAYLWLAKRTCIGRKWTVVSIIALAIAAGITFCEIQFTGASNHGSLIYGLGPRTVIQLGQFAIPLALGLCLVRRYGRQNQLRLAS
jgi:hypothetical protein